MSFYYYFDGIFIGVVASDIQRTLICVVSSSTSLLDLPEICVTAGGGTLKKYGSSGQDPIRYKLSNLLDRGFSELLKPSAKNQLDDKQVEGWMSVSK